MYVDNQLGYLDFSHDECDNYFKGIWSLQAHVVIHQEKSTNILDTN